MPYNLDVLDMTGTSEETAYGMGFEALDALDALYADAFDRIAEG